jgi:2-oxoglutarate ferredoxin oxidoreductase subunit alpha
MDKQHKRVLTGTHFMLGNFAIVEGALAAGCDFFAGYPITPANEISERMAERMPEVGGHFLQGEDELCSVFALTGASLAGAKTMTATASAGINTGRKLRHQRRRFKSVASTNIFFGMISYQEY